MLKEPYFRKLSMLATGIITCICTIFVNDFKAQGTPAIPVTSKHDVSSTEGTFFFSYPNNKIIMLTEDNIIGLYSQIESHRLPTSTFHWEYSEDITIVIFSQLYINDPDFVPLNSPYDKIKIED